jgi:hypothetical protein
MAAGATVNASTNLIIRQPTSLSFSPASLKWRTEASGAPVLLDLTDSDGTAGDGIYSATFVPYRVAEYQVTVTATGTASTGAAFSRLAGASFAVNAPLAALQTLTEHLVDDNSDSKFDRLVLDATIVVAAPGALTEFQHPLDQTPGLGFRTESPLNDLR